MKSGRCPQARPCKIHGNGGKHATASPTLRESSARAGCIHIVVLCYTRWMQISDIQEDYDSFYLMLFYYHLRQCYMYVCLRNAQAPLERLFSGASAPLERRSTAARAALEGPFSAARGPLQRRSSAPSAPLERRSRGARAMNTVEVHVLESFFLK